MEEQNKVTTNQSKIRNNEAVHFTDHLYDGNIVLRSAKPFCDAGQWRYKTQQELFRTDEGSRQYYTGNPEMYQKVKHSICHILFNIIVGIAILFAFLTGEE